MAVFIKSLWHKHPTVLVIVIAVLAFALGLLIRGGGSGGPGPTEHDHAAEQEAKAEVWTCSMHPNVRQPEPGQCPICGMDLIPVTSGSSGDDDGPREITLSAQARKLAEIQVAPVVRRDVAVKIRLAGMIEYDETRDSKIAAWVPGRLERLYVDFTGVAVTKGEPLVELYSPDLLTAQQELLGALRMQNNLLNSRSETVIRTARRTVEAAREKLRLWGLTEKQIQQIEQRKTASDRLTITAPTSGIVVHKNAVEGMYVKTGTPIYTIADLSNLWVMLDAYEADLARIKNGQQVEFVTKAFPGETFVGTVAFIDPLVNQKTRAVKVRVELPNPDGKLKPGMFVNAIVSASVGGEETESPLVVPASAPLITGTRAVVYVAVPGKEGTYEGREVVLGPRAGDYYVILSGLEEGEMVVVNGNFKIDSAIQILAKPSMMSPEDGGAPEDQDKTEKHRYERFDVLEEFGQQIAVVFATYFKVQYALSHDNFDSAKIAATGLLKALDGVDMGLLEGTAHMAWMTEEKTLRTSAGAMAKSENMEVARIKFEPLSDALYAVAAAFGTGGDAPVYRVRCPMAFNNRGAYWLQTHTGVENPYFGSKMFKCGKVVDTLAQENEKL